MKVLVTGSSGFVGQTLVQRLLELGITEIICHTRSVDDVIPPGCTHFTAIVGPETDWTEALRGVEVVFHLAARAHKLAERRQGSTSLALYRSVNRDGSMRLAEQAAKSGVRRFIFLSSVGVNGSETFDVPFTEDDRPNPQTPYALSKLEAEQGLLRLSHENGMEVVIARAPLVYGALAPGNLGSLLHAVRRGNILPLGSIRRNRRSLVSVENLVDFLTTGCLHQTAAKNQVFLVCDGQDLSTTELVVTIADALGVNTKLLPFPPWLLSVASWLIGKPHLSRQLVGNLQIDMGKAQRLLNWKPKLSVTEGFKLLVQKSR